MKPLLSEVRRLLGLQRLQRGLDYQLGVDIPFILFRLQLLLLRRLIEEEKMGVEVKSSCCSFEGMLCLGLRLLGE